jgi:hypothetical protein
VSCLRNNMHFVAIKMGRRQAAREIQVAIIGTASLTVCPGSYASS